MLMLFNTAVFAPFGFALGVFLRSTGVGLWRCLRQVALVAFGLSLCIECIQWALHVGIFEVTDLVLNTVGARMGAILSWIIHIGIIDRLKLVHNGIQGRICIWLG